MSKGRIAEAEQTVADIEKDAIGHVAHRGRNQGDPESCIRKSRRPARSRCSNCLAPGRAKNTLLLWVVSFGFLWASNGILFMLPTILQQRGIPLTQAISFQLVQA